MTRKILPGVEFIPNWVTLGGALEAALRAAGEGVTTPWVMGVTALAFRLSLLVEDGQVAVPGGESAFDPERMTRLLRGLGRKVEIVYAAHGSPAWEHRRDEAIGRVQKSIDRGVPAVVYDLHLPQFGVVKGYDDRARVWYVSTFMSGQYGEALPLARWPVPERGSPIIAVLPGDRVRVDQRRAAAAAILAAISHAEEGEPGAGPEAFYGYAAYERWMAAFAAGEPVSASGNALLIQGLQSARRDAAAFLRSDATRLLGGAAVPFTRAAAAYDAEVLALSRMMTMFPFPSGGDTSNMASRMVAAGALRQALAHEHEAIAALRAAAGK